MVFVPACDEAFTADARPDGFITFKQIQRQSVQPQIVLRRMIHPHPVSAEGRIQLPVQMIPHRPMASDIYSASSAAVVFGRLVI